MRVRLAAAVAALVLGAAAPAQALIVRSPDIAWERPMKKVFVWNRDGCTGKNVSPALTWSDVPRGTASFALTVFDPDAPTGHGWVHWVRTAIPAGATGLARGDRATGTDGPNDYGAAGYGGPCPPPGPAHRYVFTLYALDARVPSIPGSATFAQVTATLRGHVLAEARLVSRYQRR